ncbi:sensor domain-containing protein [Mycobacterium sp. Aquia_213]|uniref:sensor domain-containing protein n=1 Tax=Mycobacterium sp. Aquia_213 TaxID=2991728 RepID=UPI00226DAF3C|nr:sensor domain-containing protein [Mycobacterium sp. Aquia_213]WAC92321.1 sensor domain-containing protein [Mycobacterium sp. Aquia_213]
MALFISYSSQDRSTVDALTTALRRGQNQVWFDQELGGGDSWWAKILEQIRDCEVFIVALSSNWLQSKPSQAELRYAQALGRPILPVRIGDVDSMRVNPLAALQIIDYREPSVDAGIQLVTAVHALRSKPVPLPNPLPEEPPVPFGYITRLGNTLAEKELSPQQQLQLLVELRSGFDEDGDDPSARGDIAQLLRMLRLRHDVTYRTRSEIDNVLSEIEAKDGSPEGAAANAPAPAAAAPPAAATAVTAPTAVSGGAATGGGSNKRLLIIGGAALAVIAVIAIVVVVATQGGKTKPAPKAGTSANSSVNSGPAPAPDSGPASKLEAYLIGAAEVGTIVTDPNLASGEKFNQLRSPKWSLSSPECAGGYESGVAAGYQGAAGFTAISGQIVHTSGQDQVHRIIEAVASFSSADQAGAFVAAAADKWKACAGKTVTETLNGHTYDWAFADVTGEAPKIAQQRTRADNAKTCHHVLHAAGSMVIDVSTCGPEVGTGEAGKIAEKISAKIGA